MNHGRQLYIATYHYVRDLPHSRFPQIKGMLLDDFRNQVKVLPDLFEMATLNSAYDFLAGRYQPGRDLCLMTFDDGLKEHYSEVTPILSEKGIQGIFFPITGCMQDHVVAPVHMNHFLLAALGCEQYRAAFVDELSTLGLADLAHTTLDDAAAQWTYPLDDCETARFKYLFNFILSPLYRDVVVQKLFEEWIGEEAAFAADLYLSWEEAREMQRAGMMMGGHSHAHRPLARLENSELDLDLARCWELMQANLDAQDYWPFSYPYGKADSFDGRVIQKLRELGFCCSLCTEKGLNVPGVDFFAIHRVDCKQILPENHLLPQTSF
ncbi:MAG: est4A [Candidatus Acidoferrum typicum]|nr:est4A [Candidatus Acidoferrum typicum]